MFCRLEPLSGGPGLGSFPQIEQETARVDNSELYGKLTEIFHDVFDDEIVLTPQLTADDVDGWDSLRHIRLILSIEKGFHVQFTAAEVGRLKNVEDLAALISAKVS
jgi:acyl carrier protein